MSESARERARLAIVELTLCGGVAHDGAGNKLSVISPDAVEQRLAAEIEAAVREERARCARIAREYAWEDAVTRGDRYAAGPDAVREAIARRIEEGGE